MSAAALEITELSVAYGGIRAVKGLSLRVDPGEIIALVGANGAGKTSSLKAVVGLVPSSGSIKVFGVETRGVATHDMVQRGVSLVPEGRAIFGNLSVRENLRLGAYLLRDKAQEAQRLEQTLKLFTRLGERLSQPAGTLSGGEQQMLAIGRALMAAPKLLLLDEPSLGLAPQLVEQIFEAIVAIAKTGISVLLVEQNTRLALETAQRAYVLATGEVVLHGSSAELRDDPRVQGAYFGEDASSDPHA